MVVGVIGANGHHVVALVDPERLEDQEHVHTQGLLYLEIIVLVIQLSMLPVKVHHAQVNVSSVHLSHYVYISSGVYNYLN